MALHCLQSLPPHHCSENHHPADQGRVGKVPGCANGVLKSFCYQAMAFQPGMDSSRHLLIALGVRMYLVGTKRGL